MKVLYSMYILVLVGWVSLTAGTDSPTSVPTSIPTSIPTSAPTNPEAQHIYIHAIDLHGDGWGNDIYLRVQHDNDSPENYTLGCACKVVRIFSNSGDMTISLLGVNDPEYWWEALFTIGYSDGYSQEPFYVVGGVNSTFVLEDWELESVRGDLLYDAHDIKPNLCTLPSPKPKAKAKPKSSPSSSNQTSSENSKPKPKPKPDTRVELTLTIGDDLAQSWCDDSYNLHYVTCSAEHHLTPDARIPNILAYPRYYISRSDNSTLVTFGTLRNGTVAETTTVKLDDDESYVFSVSGHYLHDSGNVTWQFCGEEGGLGERLHFDIVNGQCEPDYIETIPALSCENEWSSSMNIPLASDHIHVHASKELLQTRHSIHVYTVFGFLFAAIAVVLLLIPVGRKLWREHKDDEWVEHLEEEWENVKKELPIFDCIADDDDEEDYEGDEEDGDGEYVGDNDEQDVESVMVKKTCEDEEVRAKESRRVEKSKQSIQKATKQPRKKNVVSYRQSHNETRCSINKEEWRTIKNIYDQDPSYADEAY